jgi:hypothetical protein
MQAIAAHTTSAPGFVQPLSGLVQRRAGIRIRPQGKKQLQRLFTHHESPSVGVWNSPLGAGLSPSQPLPAWRIIFKLGQACVGLRFALAPLSPDVSKNNALAILDNA